MLQLVVFATTWVTLLHFLFVFKCRPYARDVENWVNNVTQGALLALLLCALGLSLEDAKLESGSFEEVLRTCCAALLIGTSGMLVYAFVGQCRGKRVAKKEQKKASSSTCEQRAERALTDVRRRKQEQAGMLTDEQVAGGIEDAFPGRPSQFTFHNPLRGNPRGETARDRESALTRTAERGPRQGRISSLV